MLKAILNFNLSKTVFKTNLPSQLIISALAGMLFLFTDIIWLEVGTAGKLYYGPNVPDIYISGADITGKDKSWWGINFGWKFQFVLIVIYILNCLLTRFIFLQSRTGEIIMKFNLVLVILFPLWIACYVGGVISNSDCADLKVHLMSGIVVYIFILFWNITIKFKVNKIKTQRGYSIRT